MCGICASIGEYNQVDKVLKGLKTLEYRGYDSCGISFLNNGKIETIKTVGMIDVLSKKITNKNYKIVIGHTRWATHGVVNEQNAHPQLSYDKKVSVVHNGIIENYKELRKDYLKDIKFCSQTDTEVIANLISIQKGNNLERLTSACKMLKGSYAICVLFEDDKTIYIAKKGSPIFVSDGKDFSMASSDVYALYSKNNRYFSLNDEEIAIMKKDKILFFNFALKIIKKRYKKIIKNKKNIIENNSKNIMKNEILQQPNILEKSYFQYFCGNILNNNFIAKINNFKKYYFIACGTAYHSALLGAKYMEKYCKKNCKVEIASEFRYGDETISSDVLYIFVSQSGETADTIACAKHIKSNGGKSMAITNVPYSSLNQITDFVLPTFAGREFAVAATKTYTAQVFAMLSLAVVMANMSFEKNIRKFVSNFNVDSKPFGFAKKLLSFDKVFFIGRQQDYVTSLEACLKLREVSYINCVGMPAGELKHGSIAIVDEKSLFFVVSTQKSLKEKIENAIQEIKTRNGKVFLVSQFEHDVECDYFVKLEKFDECFMPLVSIVPFQKLAFEVSLLKGCNPDKPRNLAKSVTVE